MGAWERRKKILDTLNKNRKPVKGTELSKKFNVSRQVIVQDIALLRARGEDILATPQGYIIPKAYKENKLTRKIVCKHEGYDEIEDELKTIIDLGGKIVDVIVEHPLYGEIKSPLEISSRLDLKEFMENIIKTKAEPLSSLTEGIHIHTIEVDDEESFERIKEALIGKKYLINED
ncbi:putative transcription repressor NiaR [[Clostridium] ultunense Esp]|uniref:Putative transcription repressor NiaR n=1 Tax=[Clostridium] ultunense Esp TaxID=1288971 RepID=M1ZGH7_9FIRM|nr:transcription repressor NadR [Schnuerera ultunensis]CCQ92862.1 putative transcription repressor NiaR [[Clostridium] ultunense Esp]SHD76048.1 putative transcription repressor NiaR [[Clostridium] ultunense Esp]